MKINRSGYNIALSDDEKLLFIVSSTVCIYDISGEKAIELKCFNNLKNPSDIALSSNEKLVAYSNTSGYIAVHNVDNGKLLLKSKCLSKEGYDLFFSIMIIKLFHLNGMARYSFWILNLEKLI